MHKSEFQMAEPRVQRVDAKTIDVTRMIWLLIKEIQVEFLSGFQNYFVPMTLSNHSFFFSFFWTRMSKNIIVSSFHWKYLFQICVFTFIDWTIPRSYTV